MKREGDERHLSEHERLAIRQALRARDGTAGKIARIGRALTHPKNEVGNVKGYRIGIATCVFATFQMAVVAVLPDDERRWLFFGFAWLTMFVGVRQIDKAGNKRR